MALQRIFTSSAMNPANVSAGYGPSGVANGTTAPSVLQGLFGTVVFPTVTVGGGLLVKNDGNTASVLFYDDANPSGLAAWIPLARGASLGGNTVGTVTIPPLGYVILTNTTVGPTATYTGGPLALFAGTFAYADISNTPDHPKATVLA